MALLCRKIGISLKKDHSSIPPHVVSVTKAQQLLQGLQAAEDEGQQLTAVMEMCQVSRIKCTIRRNKVFNFNLYLCIIENPDFPK
jgi:hypothetical protein